MTPERHRNSGLLLTGVRLVTADGETRDAWLEVVGDRVQAVGRGPVPDPVGARYVETGYGETGHLDGRGLLVLPGLVDIHQHGGGGRSHSDGTVPAEQVAGFHLRHGTTTSIASLVSAPLDVLVRQLQDLVPLVEAGVLAGVHLEGPWLSPSRRGAHDASALTVPRPADVDRLLAAGGGAIRMVTIAPEVRGGLDAVRRLTAGGVAVALGHTDATYDETVAALRLGARIGTHLFNAMRPVHHRDPGPVVALLESGAFVELVADGVHLHPSMLAAAAACAGAGRTVLVTDAMAATGMPDGHYALGDREVSVVDGVAHGQEGQIAGSTVTLGGALRHAVMVAGLPLVAAVAAATRTPARALDLPEVGEVRPGAPADLLLMTPDLEVAGVLHRGRWVRPVGEAP
ncbi:MAG TPA: amidohydrolase family protein [Marmoricola sp.]